MRGYDVASWANFFIGTSAAAGVLLGLLLVGVSLSLSGIRENDLLRQRVFEMLLLLLLVLLYGLFTLAPMPSTFRMGLLLAGIASLGFLGMLSQQWPGPKQKWSRLRLTLAAVAVGPFIVGGVTLAIETGGGLYWSLVGVWASLVLAVLNVWLMLVATPVV
jgi:hypothetical protein